jgi:hypothetical protein
VTLDRSSPSRSSSSAKGWNPLVFENSTHFVERRISPAGFFQRTDFAPTLSVFSKHPDVEHRLLGMLSGCGLNRSLQLSLSLPEFDALELANAAQRDR